MQTGTNLNCFIPRALETALAERAKATGLPAEHLVQTALAQYLGASFHTLFQVSTSGSLVAGVFDGAVSVEELLRHGNFGLGTVAGLDGEMVVLDGTAYQARGDGNVRVLPGDAKAPFAVVTAFVGESFRQIDAVSSFQELGVACDAVRQSDNLFYALRLDGHFERVHTRAVNPAPPGTTRSDIYSLGVTLWYLLSGRTPFRGETLEEIHARQVSQTLPLDQLTTRRVPTPVVALLRSMLAIDPGARPQNARELLDSLHRCQGKHPNALRSKWIPLGAVVGPLLIAGVLAAVLLRERPRPGTVSRPPLNTIDRSVSVLPFENRSPDQSVAFFTGGVQDAISLELTSIAQLKVVTLTASDAANYQPGKRDLTKIARELGVSHLVEGTVQREGDHLQVSVTLTDIHDQASAWSERYDGRLADVFAIQRAITREVTDRLRATLSPGERAVIDEPPTTDPVAYDLYLQATQGSHQFNGPDALRKGLGEQLVLLNQAVARDPNFVLAYCVIAVDHDEFIDEMDGATPEEKAVDHRTLADVALQKARRIHPDEGLLHLAQAHHFLFGSRDNEQAQIEIDLARRTLPNNPEVEQMAGLIARLDGRMDEAIKCFERAYGLQPHETGILTLLFRSYRAMRRYAEADAMGAKLLALRTGPDGLLDRLFRAALPLEEKGDLGALRTQLAAATPQDSPQVLAVFRLILAFCTRDPDAMSRALAEAPAGHPLTFQGVDYPKAWFEGIAARMRGDEAAAHAAFATARTEIEAALKEDAGDPLTLSLLAVTDAGLGRADDAVREGRRAHEMIYEKKLLNRAPTVDCQLALIYAWLGQRDLAFSLLDNLVGKPAAIALLEQPTYGDFLLNPAWDPLRDDPRFAALVQRLAPKATY